MTIRKGTPNSQHFQKLANAQALEASRTPLPRVRERCLAAERQFRQMAERAEAVEQEKRQQAAALSARRVSRSDQTKSGA